MWSLQIRWVDAWVTVKSGYASRDAAEWDAGKWKQLNNCLGDPFRAVPTDSAEKGGAS